MYIVLQEITYIIIIYVKKIWSKIKKKTVPGLTYKQLLSILGTELQIYSTMNKSDFDQLSLLQSIYLINVH